MGLSVRERGQSVATFRGVQVALMETLAQWTPSAPEMEVKLLFGEHIWDVAQHADALGRRTLELRLPAQHSLKPVEAYGRLLASVRSETETARRLGAFYDVLLPGLARRYAEYLEHTDALMDAPTVRILENMRAVGERMVRQSRELRASLPGVGAADGAWVQALLRQDAEIGRLVAA